jgi:hypothetical protein
MNHAEDEAEQMKEYQERARRDADMRSKGMTRIDTRMQ